MGKFLVVQPGQGEQRHVVLTIFCGVARKAIAAALGPKPTILSVDASSVQTTRAEIEAAAKAQGAKEIGKLVLVGFSAGGGGVRRLLSSVDPEVVVLGDATHASLPDQPQTMPLKDWVPIVEKARRGERHFIASHTYNEYTNQLRDDPCTPQIENPFRSTVDTLRQLTGWELLEPGPGQKTVRTDGGLVVVSYESGNCDAPAHARQVQEALPELCARYLRPLLDGTEAPQQGGFLAFLRGVGGKLLGLAAKTADDIAKGAQGVPLVAPHGYRASVAELVADAKANGTWRPKGSGYKPKVGDLLCSGRAGENPERGGKGHVERKCGEGLSERFPLTIGGNEQDTWIEAPFDLEGPNFIGCIEVPSEIGVLAVAVARAEMKAGVKEIPGPVSNARISAYLKPCRRGGGPRAGMPGNENEGALILGEKPSDEIAWCAASASSCCHEAMVAIAG